jgi:hypothetical protein
MKRSVLTVVATLAGVALAGFVVSPAFGGPGFLTAKEAKKAFVTKKAGKTFLTKAAAAKTYLSTSAASTYLPRLAADGLVSKAEGDSKYLPSSAVTTLQVSPDDWVSATTGATVSYSTNEVDFGRTSPGMAFFNAGMTVPSVLQGRPVSVKGLEICYIASGSAQIERLFLAVGSTFPIDDQTAHSDSGCRSYTLTTPFAIGSNYVHLVLKGNFNGSTISVSRLFLTLTD